MKQAFFGEGTGPIFLDDTHCDGSETRLLLCGSNNIHDCVHSEDAGVRCIGYTKASVSGIKVITTARKATFVSIETITVQPVPISATVRAFHRSGTISASIRPTNEAFSSTGSPVMESIQPTPTTNNINLGLTKESTGVVKPLHIMTKEISSHTEESSAATATVTVSASQPHANNLSRETVIGIVVGLLLLVMLVIPAVIVVTVMVYRVRRRALKGKKMMKILTQEYDSIGIITII